MLKYVDTEVCFREVPDEISLCINLSGCPHSCRGCHSSYLRKDIGEPLTKEKLIELVEANQGITCVCFMGGDNDIPQLHTLSKFIKENSDLKTAWYTGSVFKPSMDRPICGYFDFIKVGPYIEEYGPLDNPNTNQIFYARGSVINKPDSDLAWYDITDKFWRNDSKN